MTNDGAVDADASEKGGLTVVAIRADQAQAVLDFIAALERGEGDVSGYMLSLAGNLAGRPLAAAQKHATGTGCLSSPTGWTCSDIDRTPGDE